jgi:hypothetical protein
MRTELSMDIDEEVVMKGILFLTPSEKPTWVPPSGKILAYFHGGRIFCETLPVLAMIGLMGLGGVVTFWWLFHWAVIFRDYERWSLVLATLVHLAFLALAYLFGRIAWIRLHHLWRIPPGESAALRSLPILVRLMAELYFVFAVAASVELFLMPPVPAPAALNAGTLPGLPGPLSLISSIPFGTFLVFWSAIFSLFGLVFFYALANGIETYLAIEINTRNQPARKRTDDDLVRHFEG